MGNSVIYTKPYDAEIEYLESTGTQWIDTGFIPDDTCGFYIRAYLTQLSSTRNQKCVGAGTYQNNKRFWVNFSVSGKLEISWNTYEEVIDYSDNTWYELTNNYLNSRIGTINGVTKRTDYPTLNTIETSIRMFNADGDAFIGRISNVRISKGSEIVRDFIPVRIGSVGYLYDKVSKQLFANKGTGQFILGNDVSNAVIPQQRCVLYFGSQRSVVYERIYEEYEWLKGDGSAYIDTDIQIKDIESYQITFIDEVNLTYQEGVFGARVGAANDNNLSIITYTNNGIDKEYIAVDFGNWINNRYIILNDLNRFNIVWNGTNVYINGDNVESKSYSTSSELTALLFSVTNYGMGNMFQGKISSLNINNSMNLIPCKLLHSIPSSMDGNSIARNAGECGMWDKISNRFYGNVANSGSFTVSND